MRQPKVLLSQSALSHNLSRVKQLAPHSNIVSMVKADAYGHGIKFALQSLSASDAFGVACIQEARQIRELGYSQPITLIEGAFDLEEWHEAAISRFECVIHQQQQVEWALNHPEAYQQNKLKIWLKLNAGMNRLGFQTEELFQVALKLRKAGFELILTMHFANADQVEHPLNQQQIDTFLKLKNELEPIEASCCNSAAIFQYPALHFDYVRPGIMLYGSSPFAEKTADNLGLKAVMHFQSHLIATHQIDSGQCIGYGSRYTTTRPTHLGIVAIGYGDGYPRAITNAYVAINGEKAALLGRVSMDMLAVDLTDLSNPATVGDKVSLWGDFPSVDEIAATNNTIGYELLCRLTQRPQRVIVP